MFFHKLIIFSCIIAIAQLICAANALAWGPGVHTVIALNLLKNVHILLPPIAGIITTYPFEYLYGCLAADFFIGKSKIKKSRHAHNWEGGQKFLYEAENDQDLAYSYGFLSHLAADVVAHNFFIPNMISSYCGGRKNSHLYWEIKTDYLVGPKYTKIAKYVLAMDHRNCDERLKTITGEKKRGLKAKKQLFVQSVKFSDRAYTTRHMFFPHKTVSHDFSKYSTFMLNLSSRMTQNILKHPETSPCLRHDPIGIRNLGIAKRNKSFTNIFNTRRQDTSFTVDKALLNL